MEKSVWILISLTLMWCCLTQHVADTAINPCQSYHVLNNADRNVVNTAQNNIKCDRRERDLSTLPGWYRFTGAAGDRMPTECVPLKSCGTHAPGWLNGLHPTVQEGIVARQVCYHWSRCCFWSNIIRIKNCGSYFVYELDDTPLCQSRYCGSYGENPSLRLSDKTAFLFAGKKQDFDCITSGWPLPTVKWLMNGNELKDGEMNQTVYLKIKTERDYYLNVTLVIFDVDLRHTGNYTCEVTNKYGTKKRSMFVTVSCPPALPELTALTSEVGKNVNATLNCEAYYLNQEQIDSYHWAWKFKGSMEIKEDDYGKYKIFNEYAVPNSCQQTKGLVALQIANVTKDDLGQYKCVLLESGMVLAVKDIPFYQYVSNSSEVPTRPEIVRLTTINCGRLIEVEWKQTSQIAITEYQVNLISLVDDSKQVYNLSNRNHSIQFRVQSNTAYEVQIRAVNLVGISLWAKGKLTATADEPEVFNFRAKPEGCYAVLSWSTHSQSANSCPITRYTVHFRKSMKSADNKRSWQTENLTMSNITGYRLPLNCSKTYQIMLIAWNERGRSKADGKTVTVRTVRTEKGVPFPPKLTDVIEKQCGEFNVSWRPPSLDSGGGPLTDFQVQIKETIGGDWSNCTTFLTNYSCLFKDLQSRTKYEIRVRALNRKGSGAWTSWSKRTGFIGPPDPPQILKVEVSGVNVTVQWTRPLERNCNITMYSLRYRVVKPTTAKWAEINITDTSIVTYELHLRHSKKYNVTVFAWNDLGRSGRSETWEIGTEQYVPYQPIMHLDFNSSCNSISVTWSPPTRNASGGPVTEYLPQIKPADSVVPWINCSLNSSVQSTSFMFTTLKAKSKYDVKVTAKNIFGYGWPSEILEASTTEADRPDEPKFDVFTHDGKENDGCTVLVKWSEPPSNGCPILFYTIRHKQQTTDGTDNEWIEVNVTDPNTIQKELKMKCLAKYMFQVLAWNEVGGSRSSVQHTRTGKTTEKALYAYGGLSQSNIVIITTLGLVLILGAVLLVVYMRYYKKKTKHSLKRTAKDIQVLDPCQIPPIRTEFIEALGQGAFGKVHKAKLKDGLEYFAVEQDWVNTARRQNIVAVKELHENASEEQKKEFMDEIELMKAVGKHKYVLSFLGCWTTTKPLLLIIEYIAHGDLLHWLRRKRSQITGSHLRAAEANPKHKELYAETRTQNATADRDGETAANKTDIFNANAEPSTSFEATKQREADFDGKDENGIPMIVFSSSNQEEDAARETAVDECDDDCESFDPTDLMTFAWQIARGMSYLSEKGLVHRDLAARNILVGHGKKLKIGDFGLMREVYHEVYEVKQQKKLPIKWMAPESLYEQFFSSKSDVWSYGVVLWEIATLGGSPYPLLNNADLMMLLKTEYRMEKPDLCTDNIYALMTECWKQNPDERPSFQELVGSLEKLMLQEVEYFDFDLVDETKDYYQVKESNTAEIDVEEKP